MATPVLSSRFFEVHKPGPAFYEKWRSLYSWSEKCLPVYEWQGVLFVGCLYPPETFPHIAEKVVFVLTEADSLKRVWYGFEGTVVAPRSPVTESSIPELPVLPEIPQHKVSDADPFAALGSFESSDEIEAPSELSEDENALASEESDELGDLEGLDLNLGKSSRSESTPASDIFAGLEKKAEPQSTEVLYTKPGALSATKDLKSQSTMPAPHKDLDLAEIFKQMSYHFKKSMVLLVSGDTVTPWKWDSHFNQKGKVETSITLSSPSPFRIVATTQKPYHGYVVPNEINDRFFEDWNGSQTPDHLTVTPIVVEHQVIGMLLGLGDKAADNKNSLQLAEKVAIDLAKEMKSTKPAAA